MDMNGALWMVADAPQGLDGGRSTTRTLISEHKNKTNIRYFSQKTGRRTAVSLCTYGDRPGIDRCTYGVRTGVVCTYAVSFSLADAFAIGLWLLSFRLKTKFATLRS